MRVKERNFIDREFMSFAKVGKKIKLNLKVAEKEILFIFAGILAIIWLTPPSPTSYA